MRSVLGGCDIGSRRLEVDDPDATLPLDREVLQRTMTAGAGVLRSAASLEVAAAACRGDAAGDGPDAWEVRNLATVGRVLCAAALAREESRGAHARTDHPEPRADLRCRFVTSAP
jgi:L-aspartate oxidase